MITYSSISSDSYPIFGELLNAYYRDGEDADTEQTVLDDFIQELFSLITENHIQGCFLQAEDRIIGFILWMIDTAGGTFSELPGYGTILEIGISPAFRGNGIGCRAVAHIEAQMRKSDISHFYVCVYPQAEGFWTKCGYVKTAEKASNGLYIYTK